MKITAQLGVCDIRRAIDALVRKEQSLEPWVQIRITFTDAGNTTVAECTWDPHEREPVDARD